MTSNSAEIIQDIRSEFEIMLDYVTGDQAHRATADQIERGLFKRLLSLGAKLLTLFFVIRSQASSRAPLAQPLPEADGQAGRWEADHSACGSASVPTSRPDLLYCPWMPSHHTGCAGLLG